jgi:hypothetical protein
MNFKDELRTLGKPWINYISDQKFSQRYKKNPFGTKAPRFAVEKVEHKNKANEFTLDNEPVPENRSLARTFIDDTIQKMKYEDARKPGFQFKSGTKRFEVKHPKVSIGNILFMKYFRNNAT